MMNFNESQRIAISHNKGPMLVLAGPGSGKTLVITRRTQMLIEQYGVNPQNILVITFTRAAANEMKERFEKIMEGINGVTFGTFHSVFFNILRYAYGFQGSNIIREEQRNQFFRETIANLELDLEDEKEFIQGIQSEISLVKGDMLDLNSYYSMNCSEDIFKKIYHKYDDFLRRHNLIDFDDMLVFTFELFSERKDILKLWQQRYSYILIDEFQDINNLQYKIMRLLAEPENNLFIVGDDDQSIYRFRGAKPEIMLNFMNDYKDAEQVLLDVNYRSTQSIIAGAQQVIQNNKKRYQKKITAIKGDGQPIHLVTFPTLLEQNQTVVDKILAYRTKGVEFNEMAVLFRTNTQPRSLLEKLMEYNVPFKMRDVLPNIYEHWIAKDILAYIRMAMGSRERADFYQIMNRPKRYLSREMAPDPVIDFMSIKRSVLEKPWIMERIEKLLYDLKMLDGMDPYCAISYIRKAIGYEEYLKEYAQFRRMNPEELLDTLEELSTLAKEYNTFEEWFHHMEEYKEELLEQNSLRNQYDFNGVALTTMHSAKGLEYRIVFIIDANEEFTPHHKAVLEEDMEEERRMFYVAMTRAKEVLNIYSVKERYNKTLMVSRFVDELYLNTAAMRPGQKILHAKYGEGTIVKIEENKLSVQFNKQSAPRILNLSHCMQNHLIKEI